MDYQKAFQVIASYVDASVNTSYSENTRVDYMFLSYWFKQVIQIKDNKSISDRYIARIVSNDRCHSFGMYEFLLEEGLIVKDIIPCAACNYAEGTESVYGTLYCTSCAQV